MTDLADHLLTLGPDLSDDDERERWEIDGDNLATWALRKIARAEAEIARIRAEHQAQVAEMDAWAEAAERGPERDIAFFTAKLIDYRRRLEAADPKLAKTYKVAGGTIARRAGRTSTVVVDEAAFLAWARENALEAVTVKPRVSAMGAWPDSGGEVFDPATGDAVPGVQRRTSPDSYAVKTTGEVD